MPSVSTLAPGTARHMRILVVSNLYPPHALGGYEERCKVAVEGLGGRGHQVLVLTSRYGVASVSRTEEVWRVLTPVGFFGFPWARMPGLARIEADNLDQLRQAISQHRPDVIWIWNLGGLPKSLLAVAADARPLVTDISDHWVFRGIPADPWHGWEQRHPLLGRLARHWWPGLVPAARDLPLGRAYCTSAALRDLTISKGFPALSGTPVIYCGIPVERYRRPVHTRDSGPLRMIYVGRLHPDKGVHTACAAVARTPGVTLEVVGAGEADYEARLRQDHANEPRIHFLGRKPPEAIADLMATCHGLLFPSEWEEPFALTPLEASAAGLAVVGTLTGGSPEFLREGETALTYQAGDAAACSVALARLRDDPDLGRRLAATAQAEVESRFTVAIMLDRMEQHLQASIKPATKG